MKTGRNLQEVLVELNRQNKAKQDFISPAQGMHLREDGHTFEINHLTTNQQEVFGTTSLFHRQVASALGIPAKYYDLMQAQKPELLAENVNTWFADKPSSYMVRSMDYGAGQVARALLSERYRRIDNMEIATAVLPLFAGNDQYEVMSCEVTENRLYLKVVNHRLEMEVSKGDKLVQQAISDMEKLMAARQQSKEQERSSTKKSVLDALRSLKAKKQEQPAQEQDKPKKAKKKGMEL